jgi:hypothetical protein
MAAAFAEVSIEGHSRCTSAGLPNVIRDDCPFVRTDPPIFVQSPSVKAHRDAMEACDGWRS